MKKMVITIVTAYPTEGAGSGTLITAQAKTYVEMGYEVHIITANNNTGFKKLDGVQYHLVPFTGEKEPIENLDGALPFNFLMFTSHTNSSANFWNISLENLKLYCNKFKEIYKEHIETVHPDIFHAQHCWISTSLLCNLGIPVVTTIHGTDLMGYVRARDSLVEVNRRLANGENSKELLEEKKKYEFYMASAENAARKSEKIFVISFEQEKKFKSLFPFAADKVQLVRNGCDTSVFYKEDVDAKEVLTRLNSNVTPDGKIPTDYDKMALFVGKFAGFKRVDLVLDAAKIYEEKMKEKGQNVLTLIVGAGALDEELKKQQKSLGLKNTHFVGRQGADVVRALQSSADVFLAPSDNEPDGLVYKEAMLCGDIPIGTLGGGVPDTINPENSELKPVGDTQVYPTPYGVLIPMNNAQALADATMYVLENEDKFDRNQIRQYALDNYDQRGISKKVIIPSFEKTIECSRKGVNLDDDDGR